MPAALRPEDLSSSSSSSVFLCRGRGGECVKEVECEDECMCVWYLFYRRQGLSLWTDVQARVRSERA